MKKADLESKIHKFIEAANVFDTKTVLDLFAASAVIDDVSVGEKFEHIAGVKKYFVNFFIGYHTLTKLVLFEHINANRIIARVDFTGDFGHETGGLDVSVNSDGLITHINAYLD